MDWMGEMTSHISNIKLCIIAHVSSAASDISTIDDLDELEVYGKEVTKEVGSQVTQYAFEVCDSIMNIGQYSRHVTFQPPATFI